MKKHLIFLSIACIFSQTHSMDRIKKFNPYDIENEGKRNFILGLLTNFSLELTTNNDQLKFSIDAGNFCLSNLAAFDGICKAQSGDASYIAQRKMFYSFLYYLAGSIGGKTAGSLTKEKLTQLWNKFVSHWYKDAHEPIAIDNAGSVENSAENN